MDGRRVAAFIWGIALVASSGLAAAGTLTADTTTTDATTTTITDNDLATETTVEDTGDTEDTDTGVLETTDDTELLDDSGTLDEDPVTVTETTGGTDGDAGTGALDGSEVDGTASTGPTADGLVDRFDVLLSPGNLPGSTPPTEARAGEDEVVDLVRGMIGPIFITTEEDEDPHILGDDVNAMLGTQTTYTESADCTDSTNPSDGYATWEVRGEKDGYRISRGTPYHDVEACWNDATGEWAAYVAPAVPGQVDGAGLVVSCSDDSPFAAKQVFVGAGAWPSGWPLWGIVRGHVRGAPVPVLDCTMLDGSGVGTVTLDLGGPVEAALIIPDVYF